MIVPDFWAEGRARGRRGGKQVTVQRFGWSNDSQLAAQAMAEARAQEALARVLAGEKLQRRDHKVPYNGADGLPIREQVVSRHGDEVITRNSYGARCLNTPRALFADVDLEHEPRANWRWWYLLAFVLGATLAAWWVWRMPVSPGCAPRNCRSLFWPAVCGGLVVLWLLNLLRGGLRRLAARSDEPRERAVARVSAFMAAHPDWGLRTYATPAGLRLLATHREFDPAEPAVAEFFKAVNADPMYVAMCRNQRCFRARLSAKPWRMGMSDRLKPRPGVWPVNPERAEERDAWLKLYDIRARQFAACRFERALGNAAVAPELGPLIALHDDMSHALAVDLPLA